MIRQPRGLAARRRHHVHVGVAADGRGERDLRAVGREARIGFHKRRGGQPARLAAGARDRPEVAGIREGHEIAAHRRASKQSRFFGGREDWQEHTQQGGEQAQL